MDDSKSNSQPSRRTLLKAGAAAIGGIAAPYFVRRSVLASPQRAGANDRIGIGYIGVGRRGRQLMGLPREGKIVAAADCNLARAEAVAGKYHGKAYQDYRQLLESKEVDAVIVASPDHWHTLHSIHACQAGKDVYCEKPMTLTIREGRQLVDAVRKYERVFQTGSQQRSMRANRLGCELVRSGRIGKVHTVIGFNYPSPWHSNLPGQPVPTGLDWDAWCGQTDPAAYHGDIYTPRANPGWISLHPYSGGEMTGWGAHGLDQVQWALGMDASGPVEVWTEGPPFQPPTFTAPASRKTGDSACSVPKVLFRYASGAVLKLENGPHGGGVFIGEQGKVTIDRGSVRSDPPDIVKQYLASAGDAAEDSHFGNWFACMKSRQRPVADVEIGHRSATVCHLGNIARWLGRKLTWDPRNERFVNDDEANSLVARPQRKPYEIPDSV